MSVVEPVIELEGVFKNFDSITALSNINLTIHHGERVALVGHSGSGKSTMLQLINQMLESSSGQVKLLGTDVRGSKHDSRQAKKAIATIPQGLALVNNLSVLENVMQGGLNSLRFPRLGVFTYPKTYRARASEILSDLGLSDKVMQPLGSLSGGQKQRVAIARALFQQPRVLLADEPIASLDPENANMVLELLNQLSEERGLTLIVAIHQVDFIGIFANRIVGLKKGGVVIDGPVEEASEILSDNTFWK